MTTLKNGARVVEEYRNEQDHVVLAFWGGHGAPWVTWWCDKEGNAHWGRYFQTEAEARANFQERIRAAI